MLEGSLISFMKWTKDTMSSPPSTGTITSLVAAAVSARFKNAEIATVLGRPNWATESARWATPLHAAGKKITWRCASDKMEGLYGVQHAVGANRVSEQYYIDLAVNAILDNPTLFADGDEWGIYPERTEGIFQDSTSWITPQTPSHYASFFATLMDACAAAFVTIGKNVEVNMQANNGSELLSQWMQASLVNRAGLVVVDHYDDLDPAGLEASLREMESEYSTPVYLQESAVSRFNTPNTAQITAYFAALTRVVTDGVLERIGCWGGWYGTPEAILDSNFQLNEQGLAWKAWLATYITTAPVVTSPIVAGATVASGTSTEANGTVIQVYKNGVATGSTTTVTGGVWSKTGLTAFVGGDVISATALASGKDVSDESNEVTVQAVSATPVITPAPIIEGSTSVAGTSSEANGTIVEVFVNGVTAGTTTVTSNVWVKAVSPLAEGDVITAKATASGKSVSATSNPVTVIAEDDDTSDSVLPFNITSGGTPKLRFKQN